MQSGKGYCEMQSLCTDTILSAKRLKICHSVFESYLARDFREWKKYLPSQLLFSVYVRVSLLCYLRIYKNETRYSSCFSASSSNTFVINTNDLVDFCVECVYDFIAYVGTSDNEQFYFVPFNTRLPY